MVGKEEDLDQETIREIVSMVRYSPFPIDHFCKSIKSEQCNWFYSMRTGKAPKKSFSVKRAVIMEIWRRNTIYNLINIGELIIGEKT